MLTAAIFAKADLLRQASEELDVRLYCRIALGESAPQEVDLRALLRRIDDIDRRHPGMIRVEAASLLALWSRAWIRFRRKNRNIIESGNWQRWPGSFAGSLAVFFNIAMLALRSFSPSKPILRVRPSRFASVLRYVA